MKPDSTTRFTVIGLGNLMEVIWHCIDGALGGADLAARVIATTADAQDLSRKRSRFRIPVRLQGNLDALRSNRPDIIFFAPPPTVASTLIEADLGPYFEECRAEGTELPEIYAFPPLPKGQHYRDVLGPDVRVVNIIPNNVSRVSGKPLVDEGYYVCAFPSPWPAASRDRLRRIFASQGAFVEVTPEQLVPMLGATCTIFSLWHVVPVVTDILAQAGHTLHHNRVGEFLRARTQDLTGYRPASTEPARIEAVDGPAAPFLSSFIVCWYRGVARFFEDIGFPEMAAATLLERGFDLILHTTQSEPRAVLEHHAVGAATKGGVLEKAIATFRETVRPLIEDGAAAIGGTVPDPWTRALTEGVRQTAHTVREHGLNLAR